MKVARIGCLSWFAGVFWLLCSWSITAGAKLTYHLRWNHLTWALIGAITRCNKLAFRCAIEAGAEE